MKIGRYLFSPSIFAVVITSIAIAIFSSLSIWQLQRAEYKNQLAGQMLEQNALSVAMITGDRIAWPESRFRSAEVEGTYEANDQILLDNVIKSGKPGYHVITPLKIHNSKQRILINRGWVAGGRDRRILPQVDTPSGNIKITGDLNNPRSKPVFFGNNYAPDFEENQRWAYVDIDYMSKTFNYPILPYVLFQTDVETADGLSRKRPEYVNKSGMHIGYSIQWAAFALIVFVAFIILNSKKIKRTVTLSN